nr:hypothetical protein [Tanacetum cinerariifolium]
TYDGDTAFEGNEHDFDAKKPESKVNVSPSSSAQLRKQDDKTKKEAKGKNHVESFIGYRDLSAEFEDCSDNSINEFNAADASQLPNDPDMPELEDITYSNDEEDVGVEADFNNLETSITEEPKKVLVDLPHGKRAIGTKWVFKNKKDERGIVVRNKARLVAQGHTQEEGIDYEEVFAPITRIEAIRLFLAYASFMGFMVYKMDVKSAFLYGTIEEEVYVCQPPGFEDPNHPDKVYKVVKALYGLHQAPRNYDIIFGETNKDLCKSFEKLIKEKFQMSSIGELTFFLGLQVKQKKDGIFISQDKYVAKILRKFGLIERKSASTPIDTEKPLLKDPDVKRIFRYLKVKPYLGLWYPKDSPFDLVVYSDSDYAGASLDRKSTTGRCQLFGCRLISWQSKKQRVVATSSTKAEYVAAANSVYKCHGFRINCWIMDHRFPKWKLYQVCLDGEPEHLRVLHQQFWNTVVVKQVNDVTRLQSLVYKKKVVVTEATTREVLHLDDEEGVDCLPNEEIFTELARIGYEKPSTKLKFYKAFFSSQWKFLIHTILQCMSAKRTSWNEFSSSMASTVIVYLHVENLIFLRDLLTHTTKYALPALTQKVFANIRRVGKGFSKVDTPLFEGMLVEQDIEDEGDADEHVDEVTASDDAHGDASTAHKEVPTEQPPLPPPQPQPQQATDFPMSLLQEALYACAAFTKRVEHLEYDKVAQPLEITKLKRRVKKLEKRNKVRVLKLRRLQKVGTSQRVDTSDDTVMDYASNQGRMIVEMDKDDVVVMMDDKEEDKKIEDAKVDKTAQEDETEPAEVQEVVDVVTTAKLITEVVTAASETITAASVIIPTAEPKFLLLHLLLLLYQAMKRKPQTENQARKNMMMYLKNVVGFKLDYFKGMSYDDIRLIFEAKFNSNVDFLLKTKEQMEEEENRELQTINETPAKKAAKRRKLNEEWKTSKDIFRLCLIKMMMSTLKPLHLPEREDLEALWRLVKERFSTAKPKNFSDDFLLTTLGAMFEKLDTHSQI